MNPGPRDYTRETTCNDRNNFTYFMQQVQMLLDNKYSDFNNILHTHAEDVCHKVDEKLTKLENSLDRLASDLSSLQERIREDREDLYNIKQNQSYFHERMDRLEWELEELQKNSRLCTLKFIGVREQDYENTWQSSHIVLKLLNEYSSSRTWHESDIERCYRVGPRRTHRYSPRPLIVRMHRWGDKMEILTNKDLRDLLRRGNIRISADLTERQQEEVEHHRRQGKLAYFRAGRLQVEDRHQRPATYSRNREKDQLPYPHVSLEERNTRHQRDGYGFLKDSASSRDRQKEEERCSSLRGERSNWRQPEANRRRDTALRSHYFQTSRSTSPETPGPHLVTVPITSGPCLYSEVLANTPTTSERTVGEPDPCLSTTCRRNVVDATSDQRPRPSPRETEQVSPLPHETVCEELSTQPCTAVLDPAGSEPALSSAPNTGEDQESDVTSEDKHAVQRQKDDTPMTARTISSLSPSTQGLLFNPHPSPASSKKKNEDGNSHVTEPGTVAPQNTEKHAGDSPGRSQGNLNSPPVLNIGGEQCSGARTVIDNTPQQATSDRQTRTRQAQLPTKEMTSRS